MSKIRAIIRKIIYGYKCDSDTYIKYLRSKGLKIGEDCFFYAPEHSHIDETSLKFIKIGELVQITRGVVILGHDYAYSVLGNVYYDLPRPQKMTVIGNNVFIGMNSIILNGVEIGDNVIIGAGSVVSKDCASNAVYAGNPAQYVCLLEEYYNKCCNQFEASAALWFERGCNAINPYSMLYDNEGKIRGGIGLKHENVDIVNQTMQKWKKYRNIEHLLELYSSEN